METYRRMEELNVYQKLCRLHIETSNLTQRWPVEEKFELGSQARRSSNSAPAQLAEKYDDRHIRNKMLNGMERTLEKQLPKSDRRWSQSSVRDDEEEYGSCLRGFPEP